MNDKPGFRNRHRKLKLDRLEDRRLLAVNVVVSHDPIPDALPGESISATISVSNFGDEPATDAKIETNLDEIIDDLKWTRTTSFETPIRAEQLRAVARPAEREYADQNEFEPVPVGDINADGFVDFARAIEPASYWDPIDRIEIAFGDSTGLPPDAFAEFDGSSGFIVGVRSYYGVDLHGGDFNGDGIDDLIIGNGGWGGCSPIGSGNCPITWTRVSYKTGGALILFGAPTVGNDGELVPSPNNSASLTMDINEYNEPIKTTAGDANGDGIDDVMISGGGRSFLTLGSSAPSSRNFREALNSPYREFNPGEGLEIYDNLQFVNCCAAGVHGDGPGELGLIDDDDDGTSSIWLGNGRAFDIADSLAAPQEEDSRLAIPPTILPGQRIQWQVTGDAAKTGANHVVSIEVSVADPPVAGDVDGDGVVGDADLRALIAGFGKQDALRKDGDLDEDGAVTFSDYLILSANYDQPTPLSSHPTGA